MDRFLVGIAQAQQAAAPAAGPGGTRTGSQQLLSTLFVLGSFILIFYFLLIRPQQKRQKETSKMMSALKRGDRVLTSGGIYATVWDVKEDRVVVKLTEELKVEVAKSAIQAIVAN